jgi:hypothetical protein
VSAEPVSGVLAEGLPAVKPRVVQLPLDGSASLFTREQLTVLYKCSHGELGRLLVRRLVPLPIRIDGTIYWYADEIMQAQLQATKTLERWRHR